MGLISRVKSYALDERGYSLTELLIVLVVIGILIMIAVPIYRNITTKAKATEAKMMLNNLHTLQKAYHLEKDVYSPDMKAIGFEQAKLVTQGGNARYQIKIEKADAAGYMATATAVVDFDSDGKFNQWSVDESGTIEQTKPD